MSDTGTLWVCGAATKGMFVSCPIAKPVKRVDAAGRRVAATLDDGEVLLLDLERLERSSVESSDGTTSSTAESESLVASPWKNISHIKVYFLACPSKRTTREISFGCTVGVGRYTTTYLASDNRW
jgi:hypothetical protein